MNTDHPRYRPDCPLCRLMDGPCVFHYLLDPLPREPETPEDLEHAKPVSERPQ